MKREIELISESFIRSMVREKIQRKLNREALDPDEEENPVSPSDQQPPEPPANDITGKGKQPNDPKQVMSPSKIVGDQPAKPKDINDPTATPVDVGKLKNERIARFIQTVANTSKQDLQFIINDTSPDTKAKTIKLFLKLIGVSPNDAAALITSVEQEKPTAKDKPAQPPVDGI